MILLKLFLTFLKIGTVSFGGGCGMISLIRESVINNGWLTESEFIDFIAVSESTPGPIAINIATFIGSSQAGFLGSFFATLGVVLPSFIIILIIVSIISGLMDFPLVKSILNTIRPCVVGLIIATAITMGASVILDYTTIGSSVSVDIKGIIILLIVILTEWIYKKLVKKKPSLIMLIIESAVCGIAMYGFI